MNPYYRAWLEKTGGGQLWEFIIWIGRQHRDFSKIDQGGFGYQQRFATWLEARP